MARRPIFGDPLPGKTVEGNEHRRNQVREGDGSVLEEGTQRKYRDGGLVGGKENISMVSNLNPGWSPYWSKIEIK